MLCGPDDHWWGGSRSPSFLQRTTHCINLVDATCFLFYPILVVHKYILYYITVYRKPLSELSTLLNVKITK